ncbi:MAG: circularly permuted type 2 ATP-grasp protein [Limisphaerales bacterium]
MSDTQELAEPSGGLLENYAAAPGLFDEVDAGTNRPRPHWRPLLHSLEHLGRHELSSRWESGRRILREHGVTYNIYGDPQGRDRPWDLDLVPLLITAEEWAQLESGLIQRNRLFNLILHDIYAGSQRLLRDGFLPPDLIYGNAAFLRACRGIPVPGEVYVHLHACDLGRSPDGQWWVLADRTQTPGGTGYAWENRTVISRVLPEDIRNCKVQRLGGFFRQQREMLLRLAPEGREHPNIVLLTPGPHNETYFEHTYLARHLGFALVEGADLTIRDRRVFLRTIEGLQPVDVILRRVDDAFCDPLELRSDSFLGVSGLLEACRAGNVTVANALGAGLMESPAFLPFLPGLCRNLLGQELRLASLATWWCGQPEEKHYVLQHLEELMIKPAFATSPAAPLPGHPPGCAQTDEEQTKLSQLINASPGQFVGQERPKLSQAPAWAEGRFTARSIVVRAYVASGGERFAVLPGGLTRVSQSPEDLLVSMQSGGGSKDTWILSDGSALPPERVTEDREPLLGDRAPAGVPSRAADHLFWLGRYAERLAQLLRVLRCVFGRVSGENGVETHGYWNELAQLAAQWKLVPGAAKGILPSSELSEHMLRLLYHHEEMGGVRDLLSRIRLIAAAVRDRFSGDMWRILGRLEMDGRARLGRLPLTSATALIHKLVLDLAAFEGMEMENMTRGFGWRFLELGRRLERGLAVLRLVAGAAAVRARPATVLEPVLEIADSSMTYRRRYFATPAWSGVLELLLRDQTNPRSLLFQIEALREHARIMAIELKTSGLQAEHESVTALAQSVRSAELSELAAAVAEGKRQPLLDLLATWNRSLLVLSDQVTSRYFNLTAPRVS